MKTFITSYQDMDVSRTYWKEGTKIYVRYITVNTDKKEEICTNTEVEQISFIDNKNSYYVKTISYACLKIERKDEIEYIATLANLTILPPNK